MHGIVNGSPLIHHDPFLPGALNTALGTWHDKDTSQFFQRFQRLKDFPDFICPSITGQAVNILAYMHATDDVSISELGIDKKARQA